MNKKIKILGICLIIVSIFTFFIIQPNEKEKMVQVNAPTALSNQKISWGIKREKDHVQPDLGKKKQRNNRAI